MFELKNGYHRRPCRRRSAKAEHTRSTQRTPAEREHDSWGSRTMAGPASRSILGLVGRLSTRSCAGRLRARGRWSARDRRTTSAKSAPVWVAERRGRALLRAPACGRPHPGCAMPWKRTSAAREWGSRRRGGPIPLECVRPDACNAHPEPVNRKRHADRAGSAQEVTTDNWQRTTNNCLRITICKNSVPRRLASQPLLNLRVHS